MHTSQVNSWSFWFTTMEAHLISVLTEQGVAVLGFLFHELMLSFPASVCLVSQSCTHYLHQQKYTLVTERNGTLTENRKEKQLPTVMRENNLSMIFLKDLFELKHNDNYHQNKDNVI